MKKENILNVDLDTLIKKLKELQKKGVKKVQLKGTLMAEEDGNTIIHSTEPQF
jgi:hypothetical protein